MWLKVSADIAFITAEDEVILTEHMPFVKKTVQLDTFTHIMLGAGTV